MDHCDLPPQTAPIHYESISLKKDINKASQHSKLVVFHFMSRLEGWCSESKASILMDLTLMLKPQVIVEIGVWGGKSLIPMAYALKLNEKGKIYGIDPWSAAASSQGMEGANLDWWSTVDHGMILNGLQNKITEFALNDQIELIRATSENAPIIENIDLIHIDGNHSEDASLIDVNKWVPHVRKGGLIIFDDMTWGTNASAVEWLDNHCLRFAAYADETNDWGIWVKP